MSKRHEEDMQIWAAALESEDGVARQAARDRLVSLGAMITPVMRRLLEDERPQVRWEAAMALKETLDPEAVPALVGALNDESEDVRWVAAEALAAIGEPSIQPFLRALIQGADSWGLREAAHVLISRLDAPKLRSVLEPVYEALKERNSPDVVMGAAGDALADLEGDFPSGQPSGVSGD